MAIFKSILTARQTPESLHGEALRYYQYAEYCFANGVKNTNPLFKMAFDCELEAAELLSHAHHVQPQRAMLYRNASVIAAKLGNHEQSLELINEAMQGVDDYGLSQDLLTLKESYKSAQ